MKFAIDLFHDIRITVRVFSKIVSIMIATVRGIKILLIYLKNINIPISNISNPHFVVGSKKKVNMKKLKFFQM